MPATASGGRRGGRDLLGRAEAVAANPVFAYGAILALQLRVIWNIWRFSDLTSGDTSGYFLDAISWTHGVRDDIVWSPLYTDVWGTIIAAFRGSVYPAEMAERVAIVLAAAVLVLALTRALLGPAMALLITAWWAVVPANFAPLYEVHLFGVLPLLVAAVIVARAPGRRAVGVAAAILLATALLLRNELMIATLIFAAAIVVHEIRARRVLRVPVGVYARAYGIPVMIVCLLAGGLYWRSFDQGDAVFKALSAKTDLNLCQSYAFSYQQRHPTRFTGNPFTDCQPLMLQVFGRTEPNFIQATVADPRAMGAYVLWNGRLLFSGLQVALFNATATGDQPDYPPVQTHRAYVWALSIVLIGLLVAGGMALRRELRPRRREWLAERGWAIVMFGALTATTIFVVLSERPRPEYMYAMTVALMVLTGASVAALLRRLNAARFVAAVATVLTVALIIAMPSFYSSGPRPIHDGVARLWPVRNVLDRPGSVLIASEYNFELCAYLAQTDSDHCSSPDWPSLLGQLGAGVPIRAVLNRAKATVIYADSVLLSATPVAQLVATPSRYGWRRAASGTAATGPWDVLVRAN